MTQDLLKQRWNESYERSENAIFYPKEEILRFLNHFVRKRVGPEAFENILQRQAAIRGLDYGCGIGRQAILMKEFGLDVYGIDISDTAIQRAKNLSSSMGFGELSSHFSVFDGLTTPFADRYFDITICEGVVDSMPFDLGKGVIREIERVTNELAFVSLISDLDGKQPGEQVIQTEHEHGTVQSYYNPDKIQDLLSNTGFEILWITQVLRTNLKSFHQYGRYYLVLEKSQ